MSFVVPPIPDSMVDARMADMDRLGRRDYVEIGVPMFLVAEDLTADAPVRAPVDGSGRLLAMLLAEGADALRRRKPELGAKDIARLIESLADRHFLSFAMPAFSESTEYHPPEAP